MKKILYGAPDVDNEIRKLVGELTYIDFNDIMLANNININNVVSNPDIMLRVGILGQGDVSGISLYLDNQKIGELSTEGGYCNKDIKSGDVDCVPGYY